jgi:archaellum component FlaC
MNKSAMSERKVFSSPSGDEKTFHGKSNNLKGVGLCLAMACISSASGSSIDQVTIDQVTGKGQERIHVGQASQKQIETIDNQINALEAEFLHLSKVTDGIKTYNSVLKQQLDNQTKEIAEIKSSIENAAEIERQVIPLITRMISALEIFVSLDTPFLSNERQERIQSLKTLLGQADVSTAEKLRKVFDAYQEENKYGRTIEAYRGQLELAGSSRDVDFLRVGRVALLYQTASGNEMGAWNPNTKQWQNLDASDYQRHLSQGLKVARKQAAPDLLSIPVFNIDAKGEAL